MAVENVTYVNSLNPDNPTPLDSVSEGDDHIRNIKAALVATFPNVDGAVTLTTDEFSKLQAGLSNGGVVASCKYNGSIIMYQEGVSDVTEVSDGAYRVTFDSSIDGFDAHYAPIVTPFVTPNNRPCVVALSGFSATELYFTLSELQVDGSQQPAKATGFSMLIVDMIQN